MLIFGLVLHVTNKKSLKICVYSFHYTHILRNHACFMCRTWKRISRPTKKRKETAFCDSDFMLMSLRSTVGDANGQESKHRTNCASSMKTSPSHRLPTPVTGVSASWGLWGWIWPWLSPHISGRLWKRWYWKIIKKMWFTEEKKIKMWVTLFGNLSCPLAQPFNYC